MTTKRKIIYVLILVMAFVAWVGLTKVGYVPNYFGIEILCSESDLTTMKTFERYQDLPQDKSTSSLDEPISSQTGGGLDLWKPVIYLYPTKPQSIKVSVDLDGEFLVTYPDYGTKGWQVFAQPNGKIINLADGQEYSYLFWEGINDEVVNYDMSRGFVVAGSETAKFLQTHLATLGLTPVEYNEFIVYWLPQMLHNEYNLIHFATKSEYHDRARLNIEPQPDSVLRIFMVFKSLTQPIEVTAQEIKPFTRQGFTVIEWGGTEIK